jgi:hypothetical protein
MANVNLETGKIYGAKQGSKTFYHEKGHLRFEDEAFKGNLTRQIQDLSLRVLIFTMALHIIYPLSLLKVVLIITLLLSIISEVYEELWCWAYAKKQLNGKKDDDNKTPTEV